jgi:Zn-finger nucleic acid-binding protein
MLLVIQNCPVNMVSDHLSNDEIMAIAVEGARSLDRRELESALRHSLRSPVKKYKRSHFAKLANEQRHPHARRGGPD